MSGHLQRKSPKRRLQLTFRAFGGAMNAGEESLDSELQPLVGATIHAPTHAARHFSSKTGLQFSSTTESKIAISKPAQFPLAGT